MQKKMDSFCRSFCTSNKSRSQLVTNGTKRICALVGKYEGSERESGSGNFFL